MAKKPAAKSTKKVRSELHDAIKTVQAENNLSLDVIEALPKACKNGKDRDRIMRAAIDLLVQIIRGDPVEGDNNEIKPASISQRIAAAQILLRLQKEKQEQKPEGETKKEIGIDIPPRAKNFDEWLIRVKKMQEASAS